MTYAAVACLLVLFLYATTAWLIESTLDYCNLDSMCMIGHSKKVFYPLRESRSFRMCQLQR